MFVAEKGRATMQMPVSFIPAPPRRLRQDKRRPATTTPTPPATLTLIAASFDDATETLALVFDRAIAIAEYGGAQTFVNVPSVGVLYLADGRTTLSPDGRTLASECESLQPATAPAAWLSVPAASGIVDAATGAAWAGVTELALPFG